MKEIANTFFKMLLAIVLLLGCQNITKEKSESNDASYEEKLSLNKGKKWEANEATTVGIENMIAAINSTDSNSLNPKVLAEKLDSEFKTIVAKCTMTGEAHDQLHYFILPLKDKIEILKNSNYKNGQTQLKEIKLYLRSYKKYFK